MSYTTNIKVPIGRFVDWHVNKYANYLTPIAEWVSENGGVIECEVIVNALLDSSVAVCSIPLNRLYDLPVNFPDRGPAILFKLTFGGVQ